MTRFTFHSPTPVAHDPPHPQVRPRLVEVETVTERDGSCVVRAVLALRDEAPVTGEARAYVLPETRIRAGARAVLEALERLLPDGPGLELRGTKSVRAFDSSVVIAAIRTRHRGERLDVIGAVAAPEEDPARGGALAALVAVNRLVSNRLADDASDASG